MNVVAEGVETKQQMYQLKMLKCDYGQGYLFSTPLDSQMIQALLFQDFHSEQLLLATANANNF